jgi:hypothetical protein
VSVPWMVTSWPGVELELKPPRPRPEPRPLLPPREDPRSDSRLGIDDADMYGGDPVLGSTGRTQRRDLVVAAVVALLGATPPPLDS